MLIVQITDIHIGFDQKSRFEMNKKRFRQTLQAVMKLELGAHNMLMFRNSSHFGLNVVHRREDGSIGWVDPRGLRHMHS